MKNQDNCDKYFDEVIMDPYDELQLCLGYSTYHFLM